MSQWSTFGLWQRVDDQSSRNSLTSSDQRKERKLGHVIRPSTPRPSKRPALTVAPIITGKKTRASFYELFIDVYRRFEEQRPSARNDWLTDVQNPPSLVPPRIVFSIPPIAPLSVPPKNNPRLIIGSVRNFCVKLIDFEFAWNCCVMNSLSPRNFARWCSVLFYTFPRS